LRNILLGDGSEAKTLLVALLDNIRRGVATLRDLGFLDGSEAEDECVAEKLRLIASISHISTFINGRPYEIEEQINDFHNFPDARHLAAQFRVHDLTRSALPHVLATIALDQEAREEGEVPHYLLPPDVLVAIGIRAYEWYKSVISGLGDGPRSRGIGSEDINGYIRQTLKDSYNRLEDDAVDVEFYVAMSLLRAQLGVKSPVEV
jgi:hypothetical protein